jgi:hypothetical protein
MIAWNCDGKGVADYDLNTMNQERSAEIEAAIFHEAAHIVAAYFAGYSCHRTEVDEAGNGNTLMEYGEDTTLVVALMNRDRWQQLYNDLPPSIRVNAEPIAKRLCMILVSGPIAETIRKRGPDYIGKAEVEIGGPDLIHAASLSTQFNMSFDYLIDQIYEILKVDSIWRAVEIIASSLMEKTDKSLNKIEIEKCLDTSGFFESMKGFE